MNLVRYNPNGRMKRHNPAGLDIFDDFWSSMLVPFTFSKEASRAARPVRMQVDIYEKDGSVFIEAELAGVDKNDIKVDVKGKSITIGAERKSEKEVEESNSYHRERVYGKFARTFNLPFEIDSDGVKAMFKNGILELEIPRPKEQQKQEITIN
jgi:HSP20 family protein